MSINIRELFVNDLSDESAYHLVNFFYEFAVAFEAMHLEQVMHHEKTIVDENQDIGPCGYNSELPDPPF